MTPRSPTPTTGTPVDDGLDDDDRPVGRFLSRREILALFGLAASRWRPPRARPGATATPATPSRKRRRECDQPGDTRRHGVRLRPRPRSAASFRRASWCPSSPRARSTSTPNLERSDIRPDTTTGRSGRGRPAQFWPGSSRRSRAAVACRSRTRSSTCGTATRWASTRASRATARLPPRRPAHGRERPGVVHDDLPRLVPGPRGPHPLQDPHGSRRRQRLRADLAAVLRRRSEPPGVRHGAVRVEGRPGHGQRAGRDLRARATARHSSTSSRTTTATPRRSRSRSR